MALKKSIPFEGMPSISCEYHIVNEVIWRKGEKTQINVAGWPKKADRDAAGANGPAGVRNRITIDATANPPTAAEAYAAVKADEKFSDAIDD